MARAVVVEQVADKAAGAAAGADSAWYADRDLQTRRNRDAN